MKRLRLAILLLLIPLCCVAFAALSKTTSIDELDAWRAVSAGQAVVGAIANIGNSYSTILYLEIVYASANAQDGVEVIIQVSYGNDNWTLLSEPFTTPAIGATDITDLDGPVTAGDTVISLTSATEESTKGQKWFIRDSVEDNDSESVRTKSVITNEVTNCHDAIRDHADASIVYPNVVEYILPIPTAFAYVRILINNTDADADILFTTRISKVTSL